MQDSEANKAKTSRGVHAFQSDSLHAGYKSLRMKVAIPPWGVADRRLLQLCTERNDAATLGARSVCSSRPCGICALTCMTDKWIS
jgi:hypothetical protein